MQLRYIWEDTDIKPRRYITRHVTSPDSRDVAVKASVTYKMGYIKGIGSTDGVPVMCLINIVDGMVKIFDDKESLLDHLNTSPGFRPLELEEMRSIIDHQGESQHYFA